MTIPSDTPFVYRFRSTKAEDGSLKVYGPRPFAAVLEYYATNSECDARPADDVSVEWQPVAEWARHYRPPPATERQLARLKKLGVTHGPEISEDDARVLIRAAEAELPPTKRLKEKAVATGVDVLDKDTRGTLTQKIDDAERWVRIEELREKGIPIGDDASWNEIEEGEERIEVEADLRKQGLVVEAGIPLDDLYDAEHLIADLKEAAREARKTGIKYKVEKGLRTQDARIHTEALWAAIEAYESMRFECDGRRGSPKVAELKEAVQELYAGVVAGDVSTAGAEEWVRRRLAPPAGCLASVAWICCVAAGGLGTRLG